MNTEPARVIGYATAIVTAIIGLLVAFGIDVTDEQRNAILATIGASAPVVIFIVEFTRKRVVSPESASEAVVAAKHLEPGSHHVPEIEVAGYKELVSEKLGRDPVNIDWRPKVANP